MGFLRNSSTVLEAYNLVLQGDNELAIARYRQALGIDLKYARAQAQRQCAPAALVYEVCAATQRFVMRHWWVLC